MTCQGQPSIARASPGPINALAKAFFLKKKNVNSNRATCKFKSWYELWNVFLFLSTQNGGCASETPKLTTLAQPVTGSFLYMAFKAFFSFKACQLLKGFFLQNLHSHRWPVFWTHRHVKLCLKLCTKYKVQPPILSDLRRLTPWCFKLCERKKSF